MKYFLRIIFSFILFSFFHVNPQSRINFNNQDIFLNGSNVAWVNFARDIGPGVTNYTRFEQIFAEIKADGGNSFRLWLHTDGTSTPEFDSNGDVVGPGTNTIADLQQILDLAWENEIGLMLCLWSHDMMRTSHSETILDRNEKLLTDTIAIRKYIDNALIPMVDAVKRHPAILAWEIFNEPEGFTEIGAWGDRRHVTQFDVQRFVNLTAGAIHRTDSTVKVTNGTWGLLAQSDVLAKVSVKKTHKEFLNSLPESEKRNLELLVQAKYRMNLAAEEIINMFYKPDAVNTNYYRDDRLIAAGGDPDGTLDFYTVHYYSWATSLMSPFHHPYSYWNLDKPLVVAEFFMEDAFGIPYQNLYETLYKTGYAGAMSWQWWGDTQASDNAKNNNHTRTSESLKFMYRNYPYDVVINPVPGTIYNFTFTTDTISYNESAELRWITAVGSNPFLDGVAVSDSGRIIVTPDSTITYTLVTNSNVAETSYAKIEVLLPGKILSFKSFPPVIAPGEEVTLMWETTNGSNVKLDENSVLNNDSATFVLTETKTFKLFSEGVAGTNTITDTSSLTVLVLPGDDVNRALERNVLASSGSDFNFAVDGDFNTIWTSTNNQLAWINVTLEKNYSVSRIILKWGNNYARNYRIFNFLRPGSQEMISQVQNGNGGIDTIIVPGDTARNIRIFLDQSSGINYAIREIEIYGTPVLTDVDDYSPLVSEYFLEQNYPNPFNPTTTIKFSIPTSPEPPLLGKEIGRSEVVTLKVYDILGNEVATLVNEEKHAGTYTIKFDGTGLASGVYFYQLIFNNFVSSKKMLLLK